MYFQSLRDLLVRLFTSSRRIQNQSKTASELSEQNRLLERLKCMHLEEEEAKSLQAYLTNILEARTQENTSDSATTADSSCIVLEMDDREFQQFAKVVGGNGVRLFRAIVESGNTQTQSRKLAIVGEHGVRLFRVLVRSSQNSLQKY
jgi:hypothetical protein